LSTLLLKHAELLVSMEGLGEANRRIPDGGLYVRDHVIEQVGPTAWRGRSRH